MKQQPNILFVYSDQHRADVLGSAGNSIVATPNLDRLAKEGTRFAQTWTESPICQPARASLLTGQFPTEHGVLGNFAEECDPAWDTYPRALQQAGYETAVIGKTHYANWPSRGGGPTPPDDAWMKSFGFDHVVQEFDRYVHVGFETPYTRFLKEHGTLEAYQKEITDRMRIGDRHWEAVTSPLPQEQDLTSFLAAEAKDWLEQRSGSKPWFLNLAFVQPHVPLMADPEWAAYYADADIQRVAPAIPETNDDDWARHLEALRTHSHSELLSDEFVLAGARQYYAMVSLIDQKIGEVLALLEERGELDNTLVIYASDHGEMLGDHGLMAKMCFYKSAVRVPLIVRPPGGSAEVVHDGPVQAIDIAATVLDAASAPPLDNSPARSLLPVVSGDSEDFRTIANSMIRLRPDQPTWIAATDGRYRVTYDRATGEAFEFFDLETDPAENENGAADNLNAAEIDRLREMSRANLADERQSPAL